MMIRFLNSILIITLFTITSFGQNQPDAKTACNLDLIAEVDKNIKTIDLNTISSFLNDMKKECLNNVEYSEYWNETLFKILENHPDKFLLSMCQKTDTLNFGIIFEEIESPISDKIDLNKIKEGLLEYGILKDKCQIDILERTVKCIEKNLMTKK